MLEIETYKYKLINRSLYLCDEEWGNDTKSWSYGPNKATTTWLK